ncbi:MAG: hypothetical protein HUN04_04490 [Desulfobacter sp.]|nr:MAG: hypothetical protein HUN04_04490 [Desulfobacter sp.]
MAKTYTCESCGKSYTRHLASEVYLRNNCYDCSFWLVKDDYPNYMKSHQVIVNGQHYMAYAETDGIIRGSGGRRFKIQFFDGRITNTNNLWHQGSIPRRFRAMLRDNAVFLPVDDEPAHSPDANGIPF